MSMLILTVLDPFIGVILIVSIYFFLLVVHNLFWHLILSFFDKKKEINHNVALTISFSICLAFTLASYLDMGFLRFILAILPGDDWLGLISMILIWSFIYFIVILLIWIGVKQSDVSQRNSH